MKFGRNVLMVSVAGAALFLAACNEAGLPGKNRPLADVEAKPFRYSVYETTPSEHQLLDVGGRTWEITGATEHIPANMLRPVAAVNGTQLFSLQSDDAPYDRLYTAAPNGAFNIVSNIN